MTEPGRDDDLNTTLVEALVADSDTVTPSEETVTLSDDAKAKAKKAKPKKAPLTDAEKAKRAEERKAKALALRGEPRSLEDLAATGNGRRDGEDADYENDMPVPGTEEDVDPVREVGERLAETVLAGQKFIAAVIASGMDADTLKVQLDLEFGLPGELLDACAAWAAASSL